MMGTRYTETQFFHYGFLLGWSCMCKPFSSSVEWSAFEPDHETLESFDCHCWLSVAPSLNRFPMDGFECASIPLPEVDFEEELDLCPEVLLPRRAFFCPNSLPSELKDCGYESVDGALSCVVDTTGTWPEVDQAQGSDPPAERSVFEPMSPSMAPVRDELSEKETKFTASGENEYSIKHFRYVKETKRKRRQNARKIKEKKREIRHLTQPASGPTDVRPFRGGDKRRTNRSNNKFDCLEDDDGIQRCTASTRLRGKAISLVRFLSEDLGIEGDLKLLPPRIECGHLRSAVRVCFPADISMLAELSIKTSQKAERDCCKVCRPKFDERLGQWKEALSQPVEVDDDHLARFEKALKANIPKGWDKERGPYIPNGSAALNFGVNNGGNWQREGFSPLCRYVLVFSSGKPRVVTCYSSYNTSVLTPLHTSLYSVLKRKGWLLVGDPTPDRVAGLNGNGDFLSFDYTSATDNIKSAYVRKAIDVLIDQADVLSFEEVRCLRVLGNLRLGSRESPLSPVEAEDHEDFSRGQPMGSAMSFPLLCLINKTVVDMALTDLLQDRVISFNEWTQHRCLINGDDLLTKEPGKKTNLKDAVIRNGSAVGLVVNEEKSGVSEDVAEINSTLFTSSGTLKEKKTNANAVYMKSDVRDVLGVAYEATSTMKAFIRVVRQNAGLLALQEDKFLWKLPYPYVAAVRKDKKIKRSLLLGPLTLRDPNLNIFPVVEPPQGYDLSGEEEVGILNAEVTRLREKAINLQKAKGMKLFCESTGKSGHWGQFTFEPRKKVPVGPHNQSWRKMIKKRRPGEEKILRCLAEGYILKKKNGLVKEEVETTSVEGNWDLFHDESLYPNKIGYLIDVIKATTPKIKSGAKPPQASNWLKDYIAFDKALDEMSS